MKISPINFPGKEKLRTEFVNACERIASAETNDEYKDITIQFVDSAYNVLSEYFFDSVGGATCRDIIRSDGTAHINGVNFVDGTAHYAEYLNGMIEYIHNLISSGNEIPVESANKIDEQVQKDADFVTGLFSKDYCENLNPLTSIGREEVTASMYILVNLIERELSEKKELPFSGQYTDKLLASSTVNMIYYLIDGITEQIEEYRDMLESGGVTESVEDTEDSDDDDDTYKVF